MHSIGWYRQYDAHKEDFIERYGTSTEKWLFHGRLYKFYHFVYNSKNKKLS